MLAGSALEANLRGRLGGGADKAAQDTHRELIVCEACLGRSFMCQLASFARKFRKGEGADMTLPSANTHTQRHTYLTDTHTGFSMPVAGVLSLSS